MGDWDEFWARVRLDFKRNQAWPQPFLQEDQQRFRSTMGAMAQRGWEQQHTFHAYHFDANSNKLNAMGEAKLRHILQYAPEAQRSLFVANDFDQNLTTARVAQLQDAASSLVGAESVPVIVRSDLRPVRQWGTHANAVVEALNTPAATASSASSTTSSTSSGQ